MKFLGNVDMNKNEIKNPRVDNLAAAPSSPALGQVYFNTTDRIFYGWTGTAWAPLQLKGPVTWNQLAGL